jgi:ribosomal 30S subunit maturation factor RimM
MSGSSGRASRGARRASGGGLLVPMVRDAIRHVDPLARRIDVDMDFLGDA